LLQSYDRLQRQYDAIVAIESLGHSANVAATLHHWASHLRPGGVVVIIDELFRPEVSPTNPEIQQFMRSLHFSLLLQRAPLEAMLHAAGLSELVTESLADYESLILQLCQEPNRLQALRQRIERSVRSSPLFDTAGFTRALEACYEQMWTRYQRGLPPAAIPSMVA